VKKIAIVCQKGGVGKTTLTVNLAVAAQAAGLQTIVFDLDEQESAVTWSDRRSDDYPHVEFLTQRRLQDGLQAAASQNFSLAFIDTPPAAGPQAYTAAEAADFVLIPCRPSLVDLDAIRRTAQLVKSAGVAAFAVFNAAPPGASTLLDDAKEIAEQCGLAVAPIIIREGRSYRAAWPLGKGVVESDPYGKAAAEISQLNDWVFAQLRVCTPEKGGGERPMARRSILSAARIERPAIDPEVVETKRAMVAEPPVSARSSRHEKLHVGGYFEPTDATIMAFQKLKVDLRRSQQDMLYEALRDFVSKQEAARAFR
jgi:chromosome partitioning protein